MRCLCGLSYLLALSVLHQTCYYISTLTAMPFLLRLRPFRRSARSAIRVRHKRYADRNYPSIVDIYIHVLVVAVLELDMTHCRDRNSGRYQIDLLIYTLLTFLKLKLFYLQHSKQQSYSEGRLFGGAYHGLFLSHFIACSYSSS